MDISMEEKDRTIKEKEEKGIVLLRVKTRVL